MCSFSFDPSPHPRRITITLTCSCPVHFIWTSFAIICRLLSKLLLNLSSKSASHPLQRRSSVGSYASMEAFKCATRNSRSWKVQQESVGKLRFSIELLIDCEVGICRPKRNSPENRPMWHFNIHFLCHELNILSQSPVSQCFFQECKRHPLSFERDRIFVLILPLFYDIQRVNSKCSCCLFNTENAINLIT